MIDRTAALAELEAARVAQRTLSQEYPELALLIAQLRNRFAEDLFPLLNFYFAVEARVKKAQDSLNETDGRETYDALAPWGMTWEAWEDGA